MNTNIVELLNPTLSKRSPETVGPMKAPNANVDVHNPDTIPYVSMLFEKPFEL